MTERTFYFSGAFAVVFGKLWAGPSSARLDLEDLYPCVADRDLCEQVNLSFTTFTAQMLCPYIRLTRFESIESVGMVTHRQGIPFGIRATVQGGLR